MAQLSILVVEDEAIIGMLLSELLQTMGHRVIAVAATESAAIGLSAEYEPDLLIVDAGLSSGNGLSAIDTIIAARPVPHIFTTGDAAKVRQVKPDAIILEKPFHETELAEAITRAMRSAKEAGS
jgi:CheY-like chemotaxis protein